MLSADAACAAIPRPPLLVAPTASTSIPIGNTSACTIRPKARNRPRPRSSPPPSAADNRGNPRDPRRLKADEIVGAQRGDQLAMVRQDAQHLGCRKRRVQEKADRLPAIQLAQRFAERDQMIVVHPDEIVGLQHRRQRPREHPVDAQIAREIAAREADQRRSVMKQRPQHAIGIADVVFVVVMPRQIDDSGGDIAGRSSASASGSAFR